MPINLGEEKLWSETFYRNVALDKESPQMNTREGLS